MSKHKDAFSLIELSIVILIIGILVAGVTQSSRLIRQMNLSSAQSLTRGSPVNSISNIIGWWETTLDESFGGTQPEEDLDGGSGGVPIWYDINPQTTLKNNATAAATINNPGYIFGNGTTINGLPSLQFNEPTLSTQYLRFDGSLLVNSNYSVFIVEQRTSGSGWYKYIIASSNPTGAANQLLQIGYRTTNQVTWDQFNNNYDINVSSYSTPTPRIHSLVFNASASSPKIYYINGAPQTFANVASGPTTGLSSFTNATFGFYGTDQNVYYEGNLGEIIIFNRALKAEERRSIEEYLSKKWKIIIS